MHYSEDYQNTPETDENYLPDLNRSNFFIFNSENYENSINFLARTIKYAALYGADKALMSTKSSARSKGFNEISSYVANPEDCKACERKTKAKYCVQKNDVTKIVKFPSRGFTTIPLNLVMFSTLLVLKLISFQLSLFTSFFTAPIRLSCSLIMFPVHTLMGMKKQLFLSFSRMWVQIISHSTSYLYGRLVGKKTIMSIGFKLSRALFWSIGVCFLLFGLLFAGFLVGGVVMRRFLEEPIRTSESLNFDYTKNSPIAFVPINFNNHKVRLTVALTLPESDYNMKLGMFQVRLELLSSNGKVTASSSHPCMLKYKSPQLRFIETIFKTIPLIVGFQTESQVLKIETRDLAKGPDSNGYIKVALEQRAEYESGAGLPQIYDASLTVESELGKFKQIVWSWRRTVFVLISFGIFWTELVTVLIFLRFYAITGGRVEVVKNCYRNKITWNKSI